MAEVSLIIPVYNAAPYLPRCIGSLLSQTFTDCEFIFVNDGSTDGSLEILSVAAETDARIILIDQPNAGVSAARNAGLDKATAPFVAFVDADDRAESRYVEALHDRIMETGAGLSVCGLRNPQERSLPFGVTTLDKDDQLRVLALFESYLIHNVYCKLYRREIIEIHALRFDRAYDYGEDFLFNLGYIRYVGKIATTPEILYFYDFSVAGSLSTRYDMKRFNAVETQNKATADYFGTIGIAPEVSKKYLQSLYYWNAYDAVHDIYSKIRVAPKSETLRNMACVLTFRFFKGEVAPAAKLSWPMRIFLLRNPTLIYATLSLMAKLRP